MTDRHAAARSLTGLSARQAAEVEGIDASTELTGGDARRLRGINGREGKLHGDPTPMFLAIKEIAAAV